MFRAMFSPIIRNTWPNLQHLIALTQVAVGWCLGWVETELCGLWGGYMFRAMFSPIIRSTWLYLKYLVVFTQVAAGWCPEWFETEVCRLWDVQCKVINLRSCCILLVDSVQSMMMHVLASSKFRLSIFRMNGWRACCLFLWDVGTSLPNWMALHCRR